MVRRKNQWWNKKESSGAGTPKDSKESCIKHSKHIITEIIKIINKKYWEAKNDTRKRIRKHR